jgi:iron complex outermembrane receptor protein
MRSSVHRGSGLLGLAVLLASASVPALASAETAPASVGEVIVTAQRRAESVQDVPAAISALDQAAIAERGVTDIANLQFAVPSLTYGRNLGQTQIAIRGVGRGVGQPGVALNVDGVYQPRETPMIVGQADLDRIEVLRGPQGTLYGRNANGGAVNFITVAPTPRLEGYVVGSYATYDEWRLTAVANVPLSDRVRTRFVADWNVREDGFVKNVAGGKSLDRLDRLSGRLRVDIDLTDKLTLDLNLNAFRGGPQGDYYLPTSKPSAAGIALNPYLVNANIPLKPWTTTALGPSGSHREFEQVSATFDWKLPIGELKSITAYQRMINNWDQDRDGVDLSIVDSHAEERGHTFTQEFDLNGQTGPVDWVAGAFLMADSFTQNTFFAFPLGFAPLPPGFFLRFDSPKGDTDAYAVFGDATWKLTQNLRLIGGVRWSRDEISMIHHNDVGLIAGRVSLLDTCPTQRDDLAWDSVTYRAGLQYEVQGTGQAYATVSNGFKSGGVNFAGCDNPFNPETLTSYEAGFKGHFADGRARLNLSAFWYDYNDFQLAQVIGIVGRVTNAATATVKGVEVGGQWTPDEHWSLDAGLVWLDATFGSFQSTDSLHPELGLQNLHGRRLPNAPRLSGNLGVAYRTAMTERGRLTLRADVTARSTVYFREFNTPAESQPGYAVANANLIWDSPDGRYTVRVFGNNLANRAYWVAMLSVDGFGALEGTYGEPRQVGVELKARF